MFELGEMHGLTACVILVELMMLSVQLYFYLIWPYNRRRLNYLVLLTLLIVYNVTGGVFPDTNVVWISPIWQNVVAYGSGFLMAAYFPYYFYRAFELRALRFHALYGAPLFLMLPYLVFFVVVYPLSGNLEFAISYGLILPALYSPVLLIAMFYAINKRFGKRSKSDVTDEDAVRIGKASLSKDFGNTVGDVLEGRGGYILDSTGFEGIRNGNESGDFTSLEVHAVYWAVSPWVLMSLFSYLHVDQWLEVLCTNLGFLVITVLFLYHSGRFERAEKVRLMEKDALDERFRGDFSERCRSFGLSSRETEVALRLCQGWTYRAIAEDLIISSRTVDTLRADKKIISKSLRFIIG